MSTDTCTIVTQFLGVDLDSCDRPAEATLSGRCERGHARTRSVCGIHRIAMAATPSAIACEQCDSEGSDVPMVLEWS